MARRPRIEFAGAFYHIISRGDHGEAIYNDDEDRTSFLTSLGEVCERTGWKIYAFVMMTNHYHLLLETPEPNLVAGMKWLQGTYTQRFNRRHNLGGHLFQGRYKTLLIDGEKSDYFLEVSSYIHLNPIRAGLVHGDKPLRIYRWSSFPLYLIPASKRERWLWVDRVLGELGGYQDNRKGRQSYEVYIEGLAKRIRDKKELKGLNEKWEPIRRGWYLGGEGFKGRLLEMVDKVMDGKERETYYGGEVQAHGEAEAEKFLRKGLRVLRVKKQDLEKMAKGVKEKQVLAWWLRRKTVVSRKWISQRLGMGDVSRITQAVSLLKRSEDISLMKLKKQLERIS
jgi:REP element-mobilizing transposase RayT